MSTRPISGARGSDPNLAYAAGVAVLVSSRELAKVLARPPQYRLRLAARPKGLSMGTWPLPDPWAAYLSARRHRPGVSAISWGSEVRDDLGDRHGELRGDQAANRHRELTATTPAAAARQAAQPGRRRRFDRGRGPRRRARRSRDPERRLRMHSSSDGPLPTRPRRPPGGSMACAHGCLTPSKAACI